MGATTTTTTIKPVPRTAADGAQAFFLSLSFLFYMTLLLALFITVLFAYVYDTQKSPPPMSSGTISPFPNALPAIAPPVSAPNTTQCFELCPDQDGNMTPCDNVAVKTCEDDLECLRECQAPYDLPVACQKPSAAVAKAQDVLGNKSEKYCLVQKHACVDKPSELDLLECNTDMDCVVCDDLENADAFAGETMVCQIVAPNTTLSTVTKDGQGAKSFTVTAGGSYCLPQLKQCQYTTGSAKWTEDGWSCECDKYPGVFGGDDCSEMKICSNHEVTGWSKARQVPLLNMVGPEGDSLGAPWTPETKVNPSLCHNDSGEVGPCDSEEPGGGGKKYPKDNIVCQCDGVAAGTWDRYRNNATDPRVCEVDPCHRNNEGGRTVEVQRTYTIQNFLIGGVLVKFLPGTTAPQASTNFHFDEGTGSGEVGHIESYTMDVSYGWPYGTLTVAASVGNPAKVYYDSVKKMVYIFSKRVFLNSDFKCDGCDRWYLLGALTSGITEAPAKYKTVGVAPIGSGGNQQFELKTVDGVPQLLDVPSSKYVVLLGDPLILGMSTTPVALPGVVITGGGGEETVDSITPFNQPKTTCVCSGRGSRVWDYDHANVAVTQGYEWKGRCDDYQLPNSDVVLKAEPWEGCNLPANSESQYSLTVPGKYQDLSHGGSAVYDICAADPCMGTYSDATYNSPNTIGLFQDASGTCQCDPLHEESEWGAIDVTGIEPRDVNPVGSVCLNACAQTRASAGNPCPDFWDLDQQCGSTCRTYQKSPGEAATRCVCGENNDGKGGSCLLYDDMYCIQGVQKDDCCSMFPKDDNVCTRKGAKCTTLLESDSCGFDNTCTQMDVSRNCSTHYRGTGGGFWNVPKGWGMCDREKVLPYVPVCGGPTFVGCPGTSCNKHQPSYCNT